MDEELVSKDLLQILACPKTLKPLSLAPSHLVDKVNSLIEEGKISTVEGVKVEGKLDGLILVEGENIAYPIRDRIPVLLIEEGFPLPQELLPKG